MHKLLKIGVGIIMVFGFGAGIYFGWQWLDTRSKHKSLALNLHIIRLAVEAYAVVHNGMYPESLVQVVDVRAPISTTYPALGEVSALIENSGLLPGMPKNPYTQGQMPLLAPTDPPQPGGVVFLPGGSLIALPAREEPNSNIIPRELDYYLLIAYGPHKQRPYFDAQHLSKIQRFLDERGIDFYSIRWEWVEIVMETGTKGSK